MYFAFCKTLEACGINDIDEGCDLWIAAWDTFSDDNWGTWLETIAYGSGLSYEVINDTDVSPL